VDPARDGSPFPGNRPQMSRKALNRNAVPNATAGPTSASPEQHHTATPTNHCRSKWPASQR
jgi:hypothetical protein